MRRAETEGADWTYGLLEVVVFPTKDEEPKKVKAFFWSGN